MGTAQRGKALAPAEQAWPPTDNIPVRKTIELLFFSQKSLARDADEQLVGTSLGRTHDRILYFIGRSEGLTVTELLSTIGITHQGAARAMRHLLVSELIEQRTDMGDRRQRRLYLTTKGRKLQEKLRKVQFDRVRRTLGHFSPEEFHTFWNILDDLIDAEDRLWLAAHLTGPDGAGD